MSHHYAGFVPVTETNIVVQLKEEFIDHAVTPAPAEGAWTACGRP